MDIERFKVLPPSERLRFMQFHKEFVTQENCVGFNPNDWARLTLMYPECLDWWYAPGVKLRGYYAAMFYAKYPELVDVAVLETLLPRDWVFLLERQPQFADGCDFSKFTADEWSSLLGGQNEFVEKCCIGKFTGKDRKKIVLAAPVLADKMDFDGFTPHEWVCVLKKYPEVGRCYNLNALSVECRVMIMKRLPDFADMLHVDDFSGDYWTEVLCYQPSLERLCDFNKFTGADWVSLILSNDHFAERCPWELLDGDDWTHLLLKKPKYRRHCDFSKMSVDNWNELLCKHPEWYLQCAMPESLCPQVTKEILMRDERLAGILNLTQLSAADWVEILADHPECYDICDETFGVENFNDRQLLYLRHCMEILASEDEILAEDYRELGELYGEFIGEETAASEDWEMWFNVTSVVTFEGRRYKLCEVPKPDYSQGYGFARAYSQDGKEDEEGFIRCVRLKFIPTGVESCCDEACGLEQSDEWYSPDEDDFVKDGGVEGMEC